MQAALVADDDAAATSKYARQIFQAMRPIFADLVAEIQRSIGFYSSVHRDSRIAKVLALGGHVHWAATAQDARTIVAQIAKDVEETRAAEPPVW